MRTVGAREANQQFSRLLKEAENGKHITITRNGKAVAQLGPIESSRPIQDPKARKKAIERMVRLMKKGIDLGGRRYTRDEMHDE
jgi:prevent-host-death family protein